MNTVNPIIEEVTPKAASAEIIELTVDQLGEVGGGVAYVLI